MYICTYIIILCTLYIDIHRGSRRISIINSRDGRMGYREYVPGGPGLQRHAVRKQNHLSDFEVCLRYIDTTAT